MVVVVVFLRPPPEEPDDPLLARAPRFPVDVLAARPLGAAEDAGAVPMVEGGRRCHRCRR